MIGESEVACHLPAVSTTLTIALSLVRGRKVCPGKVPLSLRTKAAGLGSAAFSGSWGSGWLVYRFLPFFGVSSANFNNASLFFPNATRRIMSSSSHREKAASEGSPKDER